MKFKAFLKKNLKSIILIGLAVLLIALAVIFRRPLLYVAESVFGGGNLDVFRETVRGWRGPAWLLFGFLQFLFTLLTVVPSEPIMFVIGMVYGTYWGTLIVWASVVAASMLIFVIVRHTKILFKRSKKKAEVLGEKIKETKKSHFFLVALLYMLPIFTYGMITIITAAFTKLKWWQYLIISAFGSFIYSAFLVFFGSLMTFSSAPQLVFIIATVALFAFTIVIILLRKKLTNWVFGNKRTVDEKLNSFKAKKPSKFLRSLFIPIYKKKFIKKKNVHFNYLYDIKQLKAPFLCLNSHPSRWDYIYTNIAMHPHNMNVILNRWYYHILGLGKIIGWVGGIPKKLFSNDMQTIKNIKAVINRGGIINFSPEGINTIYGASYPVLPATAKLIKHLKVPVVSVVPRGAFLTIPKWNYSANYAGRIDLDIDVLFTVEDIERMTADELNEVMNEKLKYNDYTWAKENGIFYDAKEKTKGLENLLYFCPKCKNEYTIETGNEKIWCRECGNGAFLDNSFQLNKLKDDDEFPENIAEWFLQQDALTKEKVKVKDYEMREKCTVKMFSKSGWKMVDRYDGEVVINKEGVRFCGNDIKTGETVEVFQTRENLPMTSNTLGVSFDYYIGDLYYEFVLHNGIKACEASRVIHHLHNFYNV